MKLTVGIMRGSKPKVLATGKFLPHKREFCAHHTRKKYVSITSSSEEVRGYGYRGDRQDPEAHRPARVATSKALD